MTLGESWSGLESEAAPGQGRGSFGRARLRNSWEVLAARDPFRWYIGRDT